MGGVGCNSTDGLESIKERERKTRWTVLSTYVERKTIMKK